MSYLLFTALLLAQQPKAEKLSVNDLSLEVTALQTLYNFKFNAEQMNTLRRLARETADEPSARQAAKVSDEYRKALLALRDALLADDEEKIAACEEKLDALREQENPELDDAVELTDEARKRAPEVLKKLSANQVALFLSAYGGAVPDPRETLRDALDEARKVDGDDWKQLRDSISDEVGRLTAGLDAEKAAAVGARAVQLLIRVRALKDDEFKSQRQALEKEIDEVVGEVGPLEVIRNLAELSLAELLSNPRLPLVLTARLK